mmetsp:Transcript_42071/g.75874  ORF Transcript_42071/g.75874 Transcript_42071/m.75874 type:complete len:155 (-) Transcript_42071:427-891(-)|eukprot:CAMPEP_0201889294 /NCGR_PEP_ID=MMETSP0902-20130614/29663_1 /ASSEMBLY_ACC=CAM_ASM_000551 /TAXON_ID=420261 /ORGANISM="Thalassiosira antarctica, Strain CCMP982" /LENGTH=154 /DNA_ID=CAMNT_0048419833 /DNA_START=26 /DNA_END=490 /DNA_ORIENTATION=-
MTVTNSRQDPRSWFLANELPWTPSIGEALDDLGVDSVEDIKMMKPDEWNALFADDKPIKQRKAEKVYGELCQEAMSTIPVVTATAVSPNESQSTEEQSTRPQPEAPSTNIMEDRLDTPTSHDGKSKKTDEDECVELCLHCCLCCSDEDESCEKL